MPLKQLTGFNSSTKVIINLIRSKNELIPVTRITPPRNL
jgi:hypothetical protein